MLFRLTVASWLEAASQQRASDVVHLSLSYVRHCYRCRDNCHCLERKLRYIVQKRQNE